LRYVGAAKAIEPEKSRAAAANPLPVMTFKS